MPVVPGAENTIAVLLSAAVSFRNCSLRHFFLPVLQIAERSGFFSPPAVSGVSFLRFAAGCYRRRFAVVLFDGVSACLPFDCCFPDADGPAFDAPTRECHSSGVLLQ